MPLLQNDIIELLKQRYFFRKLIFLRIPSVYLLEEKEIEKFSAKYYFDKVELPLPCFIIKGTFLNRSEIIFQKKDEINLRLNNDFIWKEIKIIETDDEVDVNFSKTDHNITFTFNKLFRDKDFFSFEAAITCKKNLTDDEIKNIEIYDKISFQHQIMDLSKSVGQVESKSYEAIIEQDKKSSAPGLLFFLPILFILILAYSREYIIAIIVLFFFSSISYLKFTLIDFFKVNRSEKIINKIDGTEKTKIDYKRIIKKAFEVH